MLVEQQAVVWYITAVYEHPLLMKQENVGINSSFSRMPALVRESVNSLQPAIYLVSFWWLVVKNKKNTISAGSTFWKTTQKRTLHPIMNGLKVHWSSGSVLSDPTTVQRTPLYFGAKPSCPQGNISWSIWKKALTASFLFLFWQCRYCLRITSVGDYVGLTFIIYEV